MLVLRFRFPAGRYHATPYGHHVNEGVVEWPPSPWRLLRALVACGYATQRWREIPEHGRRLVSALASALPRYRLPAAVVAHSRHYMPTGKGTTLVFDAWAHIGDGEVLVGWDVALDDEARSLLGELASTLGYLGRSESWVEAELLPAETQWPAGDEDAYPHRDGHRAGAGWEQVGVMAPVSVDDYDAWRKQCLAAARDKNAEAQHPEDLVEAIQCDTAWWKKYGWSQPPGSQRVLYWRRSDALQVSTSVRSHPPRVEPVEAMLLAITTPSGRTSALPRLDRTLPQAELLHRALVSHVSKREGIHCPELTGRDAERRPLKDDHRHAHILPVDLDGDGRLDHVVVYARMGLGRHAQMAVRSLRRTWTKGGVGELQVAVAGSGSLADLYSLPQRYGMAIARLLGPTEGARVWVSETVFVPPRHLKRRGRNTLDGQVQTELVCRGFPPAAVDVLPWAESTLHHRHTKRVRRDPAKPPPADIGYVLQLSFEQPVRGPILLGYGSHFGLGRFGAQDQLADE